LHTPAFKLALRACSKLH